MANVLLQAPFPVQLVLGPVTGQRYAPNGKYQFSVDPSDAIPLQNLGYVIVVPADTGGIAILDFGAFPGSPAADLNITGFGELDATIPLNVIVAAIDTVDHSADEHMYDPPAVAGRIVGSTIVLHAYASGRDTPPPPLIPFGNKANSQMPIPQPQHMPYGKWSVAWSLVQ